MNFPKLSGWQWITVAIVASAGFFAAAQFSLITYADPPSQPGVGSGAIAVDAVGNVGIGTSTTQSDTKLLVVASSTGSGAYALRVLQPNNSPLLIVRNDGKLGIATNPNSSYTLTLSGDANITGTLSATAVSGSYTGTMNAANVSAGQFGANTGGGNYSFPASVGIGTTGPTYKLDVASGGATTARFGTAAADTVIVGGGAGKVDAGTVDPIYTIGGVSYATYLPGMTGVKEETTGVVSLQARNPKSEIRNKSECPKSETLNSLENSNLEFRDCLGFSASDLEFGGADYQYVIDFNSVPVGSDLWLFAKATNIKKHFDQMAVLLTPAFEGKVWYDKDASKNRLTIFATMISDYNNNSERKNQKSSSWLSSSYSPEVSYRLTAPRFDAEQWSNYNTDGATGFIIKE